MTMVDSENTNSSHSSNHEETCTRLQVRPQTHQQQQTSELDDSLDDDNKNLKALRSTSPLPKTLETAEKDIDTDEDDSSEQSRSDYLLDSLLNPSASPNDSNKHHNTLTISGLSLSSPMKSQRGSSASLDDLNSSRKQSLDEWNTNSSLHSESEAAVDKTWTTLDSIHSRASTSERGSGSAMDVGGALMDTVGNSSMDFNDSCCSFASFGGSDSSLNDSGSDLSLQRAAFTRLTEEPTPRRVLMAKTQSLRLMRARSYRGSSLTLIEESNSLD